MCACALLCTCRYMYLTIMTKATLTINAGVESYFVLLIRQNYGRNSMLIKDFL